MGGLGKMVKGGGIPILKRKNTPNTEQVNSPTSFKEDNISIEASPLSPKKKLEEKSSSNPLIENKKSTNNKKSNLFDDFEDEKKKIILKRKLLLLLQKLKLHIKLKHLNLKQHLQNPNQQMFLEMEVLINLH